MTDRFTRQFAGDDEQRRQQLINKIERALAKRNVTELEAIAYDLFAKGYLDE